MTGTTEDDRDGTDDGQTDAEPIASFEVFTQDDWSHDTVPDQGNRAERGDDTSGCETVRDEVSQFAGGHEDEAGPPDGGGQIAEIMMGSVGQGNGGMRVVIVQWRGLGYRMIEGVFGLRGGEGEDTLMGQLLKVEGEGDE